MSLKPSNDDFDDELLSAFVDDELTTEERARVQERLRTDPRAAAMVEELRALSSAVKSIPREMLPRDLRASVLSELGGSGAGESTPSTLPMPSSNERWAARRRGLVWSAIAIAAALMLTVFQPKVEEEGAVARRARQDADQPAQEPLGPAAKTEERARLVRESPSLKAPDTPAASAPRPDDDMDKNTESDRSPAVGGAAGFGGGGSGFDLAGPAGAPATDAFNAGDTASDTKMEAAPKAKEQLLMPQGAAVRQGGQDAPLDSSELADVIGGSAAFDQRKEGAVANETTSSALAGAGAKYGRPAGARVRVEEITIVRPDAVARFKKLLVENKIDVSRDKAAADSVELGVALEGPAPEEILVAASAAQIEKLLVECRADKAFVLAPAAGRSKADAYFADAGLASRSAAGAARSLAEDEAKALSNQSLTAEQPSEAAASSGIHKDQSDSAKSAEPPTFLYGAPAPAAAPGASTRALPADGVQAGGGAATSGARLQVLFRFVPPKGQAATPAAK